MPQQVEQVSPPVPVLDWHDGRAAGQAVIPPVSAEVRGRPPRRPIVGYLLPVRLRQLVVWQVAGFAVLATLHPFGLGSAIAIGLAALAFLATSVRIGGRCGDEWLGVLLRFRSAPTPTDAADALHAVVPGLDIRTHTDRGGNRVGIARVGDGWSAVLRLNAPAGTQPADLKRLLRNACDNPDIRLAGAQLVVRTVPGPHEPQRAAWLGVRFRPADAPNAVLARGGGELGAVRATAAAALMLARQLHDAGHPVTVLDGAALRDQLQVALGADPAAVPREEWDACSFGALRQSCFRPSFATSGQSLLVRFSAEAAFTCTSYRLRRARRGQLRADVVVRIGAEHLNRRSAAAALGVAVDPLDGCHGAFVRATLPLAL